MRLLQLLKLLLLPLLSLLLLLLLSLHHEEEGRLVHLGEEVMESTRRWDQAGFRVLGFGPHAQRTRHQPPGPSLLRALLKRLGPVPQLLAQQTGIARLVVAIEGLERVERSTRLALPTSHTFVDDDERPLVVRARERKSRSLVHRLLPRDHAVVHQAAPLLLVDILPSLIWLIYKPRRRMPKGGWVARRGGGRHE